MTAIDEIVENFELLEQWDDRYRYVIELGRTLAPFPDSAHIDANKVQGCASQVWLITHVKPDGSSGPVLTFEGDSDAHIVRGLIAILFALYSGKSAREILATDAIALFDRIGLRENLDAPALERPACHGGAYPRRGQRRTGHRSVRSFLPFIPAGRHGYIRCRRQSVRKSAGVDLRWGSRTKNSCVENLDSRLRGNERGFGTAS